jgi:hypothetical protein
MKAHPQMREIMVPLSVELHNKFPSIFEDNWGRMEDRTDGILS